MTAGSPNVDHSDLLFTVYVDGHPRINNHHRQLVCAPKHFNISIFCPSPTLTPMDWLLVRLQVCGNVVQACSQARCCSSSHDEFHGIGRFLMQCVGETLSSGCSSCLVTTRPVFLSYREIFVAETKRLKLTHATMKCSHTYLGMFFFEEPDILL